MTNKPVNTWIEFFWSTKKKDSLQAIVFEKSKWNQNLYKFINCKKAIYFNFKVLEHVHIFVLKSINKILVDDNVQMMDQILVVLSE